jgi:hypothetical protein
MEPLLLASGKLAPHTSLTCSPLYPDPIYAWLVCFKQEKHVRPGRKGTDRWRLDDPIRIITWLHVDDSPTSSGLAIHGSRPAPHTRLAALTPARRGCIIARMPCQFPPAGHPSSAAKISSLKKICSATRQVWIGHRACQPDIPLERALAAWSGRAAVRAHARSRCPDARGNSTSTRAPRRGKAHRRRGRSEGEICMRRLTLEREPMPCRRDLSRRRPTK